jgi:hypothetical protein
MTTSQCEEQFENLKIRRGSYFLLEMFVFVQVPYLNSTVPLSDVEKCPSLYFYVNKNRVKCLLKGLCHEMIIRYFSVGKRGSLKMYIPSTKLVGRNL